MRCDDIQQALSERMDGERPGHAAVLDDHVSACPDCQAFLDGALLARRDLRVAALGDDIPDIVPAVIARLPDSRRPRVVAGWHRAVPVAASLVVGVLVGALLVATAGRGPVVAEELAERVLAAQHTVTALSAEVTVEEHGWHPEVPVRSYRGTLDYRSPEQLVIALDDRTAYPSGDWQPNDVLRVVTPEAEWTRALPTCPTSQLPECAPDTPRLTGTRGRVPFSGVGGATLDVVVPVESFRLGGGNELGTRTTDEGEQIGVTVDVAQVAPLLSALTGAGNWRELHPADRVELWVDGETLAPRELTVLAGGGGIRERWGSQRGLEDRAGAALLRVTIDPVPATGFEAPAPPSGLSQAGFVPGPVDLPAPELPEGMQLYRSGIQPTSEHEILTASWTDGRAWVRLRGVEGWTADRLFGDVGRLVRRTTLPDGRVVYVARQGQAIAVHTDDLELLLEGSLSEGDLLAIAASLPVSGEPVPTSWTEVAGATVEEAVDTLPDLLVPTDLAGFGPPAVQLSGEQVVIGFAGSGSRELVITQRRGSAVAPPVVADVIGVEVRGRAGRYLPDSGELEWVEDGSVISIQSRALGLEDLIRIADQMESPA